MAEPTKCNIILLEDNREHRSNLSEDLKEECKHLVNSYRDIETFKKACDDGTVLHGFEKRPLIIILDIMMAERLDENADFAPRLPSHSDDSTLDTSAYCNDNLGLEIAIKIRNGNYDCIPKGTPILFFTARQEESVFEEIDSKALQPAICLEKPAWIDEVQDSIEKLIILARL